MRATKILVVDDEPDLELLVTQKFRRRIRAGEYAFLFARDGEEALSLLQVEPDVDVILSDINMPRMDGLTLLERLQELSVMLRTVIVSAYGDMKNIRTAMNRGAFDFVTKPIDFDDLEITIAKTISDLKALREAYQLRAEAERAHATLARYFSPHLADHLAKNPDALALGGERRDLTFLFTDLADFTPLVERLEPSITVGVMNDYLTALCRIVFTHGGTVLTLVGDAIHAMFGAPVHTADHAIHAVACALEIDAFAQAFAAQKKAEGVPIGHTRIGVHTGSAIVGNFGGDAFFHYTAYGDAVNTAARLEAANKPLGTRVCVSGETVRRIADFVGRPVGTLLLKGKEMGIEAYEPLNGTASQSAGMESYRQAFGLLARGDSGAVQRFAACVGAHGDDTLATFHLKRLLAGQTGPVINLTSD